MVSLNVARIELGVFKTKPKLLIYKFRLFVNDGPEPNPSIKLDLWLEPTGFVSLKRWQFKDYFVRSARISLIDWKITRAKGDLIDAENTPEVAQMVREILQIGPIKPEVRCQTTA